MTVRMPVAELRQYNVRFWAKKRVTYRRPYFRAIYSLTIPRLSDDQFAAVSDATKNNLSTLFNS